MFWPFNHFKKSRLTPAGTIEAIYGMIVTQAREPIFYRDLGVPDTVNGRFDLLLLHLWLLLRRLRTVQGAPGGATELSQALFDRFCEDMDDNLREIGIGDLSVPKHMKRVGEAFYGRAQAYGNALAEEGDAALIEAVARNVYGGNGDNAASRLAAYIRRIAAGLDRQAVTAIVAGALSFPDPALDAPSKGPTTDA